MKKTAAILLLILFLCGCQSVQTDSECEITVTCEDVFSHREELNPDKAELVPEDGILFSGSVAFQSGENLLSVMQRAMREKKIPLVHESNYITSIGWLSPGDCGEMSGWMFTVNGEFPLSGCDQILLQDGDVIAWTYVCEWQE